VSQHFTDLRLNTRSGSNEESFWPSFTDIMTVVVIIFLIAMLVLLLNNMDLVQRLQSTLAAERAASEQVASTSSQNRDLQDQLLRTQTQVDMLRMQLMDMGEERDHLTAQLAQNQTNLEQSKAELAQERSSRNNLETQLAQASGQLVELGNEHAQQQERIRILETERQQAGDQLAALQNNFATLKVKYDKLVQPARSAKGKYVVNVRIMRQGSEITRFVQSPEQHEFVAVSETGMYSTLDKLHAGHKDDMYVRIIFPDDSGLSYSEAWEMTEALLRKYDYYYREASLDRNSGK